MPFYLKIWIIFTAFKINLIIRPQFNSLTYWQPPGLLILVSVSRLNFFLRWIAQEMVLKLATICSTNFSEYTYFFLLGIGSHLQSKKRVFFHCKLIPTMNCRLFNHFSMCDKTLYFFENASNLILTLCTVVLY